MERIIMHCETCQKEVAYLEAHSMVVVLQKVDHSGYAFMQCEQGSLVDGHNFQHWHCNRNEMLAGVRACITNHYQERLLVSVSPLQVRLHQTVLRANLSCKVCGSKLTYAAYRFCLTHATPKNSVPDDSMNELGEWCCGLEHARQSVLKTIDGISGGG